MSVYRSCQKEFEKTDLQWHPPQFPPRVLDAFDYFQQNLKNTKRDTVIAWELEYSMGVQNNICLNTVLKSKSGLKLERFHYSSLDFIIVKLNLVCWYSISKKDLTDVLKPFFGKISINHWPE